MLKGTFYFKKLFVLFFASVFISSLIGCSTESIKKYALHSVDTVSNKIIDSTVIHNSLKDSLGKQVVDSSVVHFKTVFDDKSQGIDFINIIYAVSIFLLSITVILFGYYHFAKRSAKKYYSIDSKFKEEISLQHVLYDLNVGIIKYNILGIVSLIFLILTTLMLGAFVFDLFKNTLKDTVKYQSDNTVLISLLLFLRTSLLGTFILSIMVYVSKFMNSSFDQAVRFNKRKDATVFLIDLFNKFKIAKSNLSKEPLAEQNSLSRENLEAIIKAFREWNVNIESAYTASSKGKKRESEPNSKFDDLAYEYLRKMLDKQSPPQS